MTRIILSALMILLISGSAWAVDSKGGYAGKFPYTCPQVLEFHSASGLESGEKGVTFNKSFGVIIGWMAGYMSRVNFTIQGKTDFFENMAQEVEWVVRWCQDNQAAGLNDAMEALTKARTAKKPKTTAVPPAAPKSPLPPARPR